MPSSQNADSVPTDVGAMLEFLHTRLLHGGYYRLVRPGVDFSTDDLGHHDEQRVAELHRRRQAAGIVLAAKVRAVLQEQNDGSVR